jgi:hypothetical protein
MVVVTELLDIVAVVAVVAGRILGVAAALLVIE